MSKESGAIKALLSATKKNERMLELIIEFEELLTGEIESNYKREGSSETFRAGVNVGLETAKSIFLVRVWKKLERLYD
ncbi:hypothetical protein [Sporosarcina sp. FSL K6-3457]|uniref:hypothetical protein n=1 Tax=Sporosarcina sp. FSL K6-3457 TaxID=2978204 RepID=UPI0030FADADA